MFDFFGRKKREKPLVVHADDDTDICEIVRLTLGDMGIDVVSAYNGTEGMAAVRKHVPDLLICDVRMPGADGFTVCYTVKNDPKTKHIPVLMVTAMGQNKDVEKALAQGADGYIVKSMNYNQFKAKVAGMLGLQPPPAAA